MASTSKNSKSIYFFLRLDKVILFFVCWQGGTKVKKIQKSHDSRATFLYYYKVSPNKMTTKKE
ncbi:hypothetical protein RV10_GL001962 [Enterococcus pallens]|nr:hypothetical protein RV10_GL001962 [Enterococcus pallens]